MEKEELKRAIDDVLCLDRKVFATLIGVSDRAVIKWLSGERPIPQYAENYTRLLTEYPESLEKAWRAAGQDGDPPKGKRGPGRPKKEPSS